jgi:hypothetical protein
MCGAATCYERLWFVQKMNTRGWGESVDSGKEAMVRWGGELMTTMMQLKSRSHSGKKIEQRDSEGGGKRKQGKRAYSYLMDMAGGPGEGSLGSSAGPSYISNNDPFLARVRGWTRCIQLHLVTGRSEESVTEKRPT